jgi:hypothetical protein
MASACQLKSEGGLNSRRIQYGLIDCTGGGTGFYGTQNARIITNNQMDFEVCLLLR